jgi:hypothetical protein
MILTDGEKCLLKMLYELRPQHYVCDGDEWYSCPLAPEGCLNDAQTECNCGAEDAKAQLETSLKAMGYYDYYRSLGPG